MKFSTIFTTVVAVTATSAAASPFLTINPLSIFPGDYTRKGNYGASIPPWKKGAKPSWYVGNGKPPKNIPCLSGVICKILKLFPKFLQCPKPPPTPNPSSSSTTPSSTGGPVIPSDGYNVVFANLTGATQADGYLTFGLVDTVADCKNMCNSIPECDFANTYRDVNGKDGSPLLTCSLYSKCHDASTATNTGGQTQPDGSINYITDSYGWCKAT